jgi:DNA-binding MarR family transcriptional regulator
MHHTEQGQLFTQIILELFKLNGLLIVEGDRLTKAFGMSSARWKVLGALALSPHPMTVSQIAHAMGQTRQGVQRLADAMQKDGILNYQNNPQHKRAKLVVLSNQGKKIFEALDKKQIPWANAHSANMDVDAMETTLSVLQTMTQALDHQANTG